MPAEERNICLVRGCGGRVQDDIKLCDRCYVMLSRGLLMPSAAWFATELEFMDKQNHQAIQRICDLSKELEEAKRLLENSESKQGRKTK